jgi:hypothetical protein
MDIILPTFADFDNPHEHTAQYPLTSMLFMALVATLSGATTSTEIAQPRARAAQLQAGAVHQQVHGRVASALLKRGRGTASVSARRLSVA